MVNVVCSYWKSDKSKYTHNYQSQIFECAVDAHCIPTMQRTSEMWALFPALNFFIMDGGETAPATHQETDK